MQNYKVMFSETMRQTKRRRRGRWINGLNLITATVIVTAIFIFGVSQLDAQASRVVEMRIGNTVYELDTVLHILKNKTNKITWQEVNPGDCRVSFGNDRQAHNDLMENFRPIFSKERAEELKVMIHIYFFFDTTGQIREIAIMFRNREIFEMFTLSEIKAIEDAAKKHRYENLEWFNCDGAKYGHFVHPFSPYLLYFERPR